MDLQTFIIPMLTSNPRIKTKIESLFNQPIDHVMKCAITAFEQIKSGPGLMRPEDKQIAYRKNFDLVRGLGGFQDYEIVLLASEMSGFELMDVVQYFRNSMRWDVTADDVMGLRDQLLPRFKEKARRAGLLKDEETKTDNVAIPVVNGLKSNSNTMVVPDWIDRGAAKSPDSPSNNQG